MNFLIAIGILSQRLYGGTLPTLEMVISPRLEYQAGLQVLLKIAYLTRCLLTRSFREEVAHFYFSTSRSFLIPDILSVTVVPPWVYSTPYSGRHVPYCMVK